MKWSQEEINEMIQLCKNRSMTDKDFRLKLLNDPAAAVKELTGKEIPAGLKMQVLEQDSNADLALVLPPFLPAELTDDELDFVAGGKTQEVGCTGHPSLAASGQHEQRAAK